MLARYPVFASVILILFPVRKNALPPPVAAYASQAYINQRGNYTVLLSDVVTGEEVDGIPFGTNFILALRLLGIIASECEVFTGSAFISAFLFFLLQSHPGCQDMGHMGETPHHPHHIDCILCGPSTIVLLISVKA